MKGRLIRNATIVVEYGGKTLLLDPYLAKKGAYPGFAGTMHAENPHPTVELPVSAEELLDPDAVIVTHLHEDHFDEVARKRLPNEKLLFVQNEHDEGILRTAGFYNLTVLKPEGVSYGKIHFYRTGGKHGLCEVMRQFEEQGETVCGVVMQCEGEPTVYVGGDSVWCEEMKQAVDTFAPDLIFVNAGDAKLADGSSITIGTGDIAALHKAAPQAKIVVIHMEAVNHATLSRAQLRQFVKEQGIQDWVSIPEDGDVFTF